MTKKELCLVIPALNEKEVIGQTITELKEWMASNLSEVDYEILVVDDGSSDGMGEMLVDQATSDPLLRVVRHTINLGRGQAIQTAIQASDSNYLITLDADLSYAPEHIAGLLEPLRSGEADLTLASPYAPGGQVSNVPFQRAWLSRIANYLLSSGFSGRFHTVTCIVRGYSRRLLDDLELVNTGKELHLEVVQKSLLLNYRIVEVPAHLKWRDKKRGRKPGLLPSFALFKMRGAIALHLLFHFCSRPSAIFIVPIFLLTGVLVVGSWSLLSSAIKKFQTIDGGDYFEKIYFAVRQTLIDGQLTLTIIFFAFFVLFILFLFYFLAHQNRRHYEEQFILLSRLKSQIRDIAKKD